MTPTEIPAIRKFDYEADHKIIGNAIVKLFTLMLRPQDAEGPTAAEAEGLMAAIREGLLSGSMACAEVKRLRGDLAAAGYTHRPRPHADPTTPGALCAECSLGGQLIAWPCQAWALAEKVLKQHQP